MALDNFIVSDFVKATTEKKKKNETTVFGTVNSYTDSDGRKYVKIDGAEELTPVMTTAELKEGDRVAILVKDHSAIIMGNITSQSASTDTVEKVKETADMANTNATDAKQTVDDLEERANNGEFNGADGISITSVINWYIATSDKSTVPSVSGSDLTSKWTTNPSSSIATITPTNRYLWNYEVTTYNKGEPTTKGPVIIGTYGDKGDTGRSIESVTNYYQATSDPVEPSVSSMDNWTTDPADEKCQTSTSKRYLWNYEVTIYSDSTKQVKGPVIIGTFGNTGNGIASTEIRYQGSTSGTDIPTGAWTENIPALASGQYLWTRTVIDYTFSEKKDISYSVSKIGDDGIGIDATVDYYITTSDPVVPLTSSLNNWTTDPSSSDAQPNQTNRYLWNYQIITYTNGSIKKIGPRIIGTYGDKGDKGDTGKGISNITEYYLATSESTGITLSTPGWSTTIQSMTSFNKYLWNYRKTEYTTGNPTNTTPCIIGTYGDTGATGGTGATGKGITSIVDQYAKSTSDTTPPPNNNFSTQIPEWTSGEYIWRRQKITWTDDTITYTEAVADKAFNTLFSQDIYMTGKFTNTVKAYLRPTVIQIEKVKELINSETYDSRYDLNCDGVINGTDLRAFESLKSGSDHFSDYPDFAVEKSDVSLVIDLTNPDSAITFEGVNMWGSWLSASFGINSLFANHSDDANITDLNYLLTLNHSQNLFQQALDRISALETSSEVTVDDALSPTSTNPVQNKVVAGAIEVLTEGQNESIIALQVDGRKITYIKGDGSEYCFETQDTNTEYFLANDEETGLTKLYRTIGANEDGTMTQKAITDELNKKVGVKINKEKGILIFTNNMYGG